MSVYLGNQKVKVILNGTVYKINLNDIDFISNTVRLLSSDGYVLKDLNDTYLVPKESD